jgi:mannan endo-1,4-beta-mannosidase
MSGRTRTVIGAVVVAAVVAGGALWWLRGRNAGPGPEFVTAEGGEFWLNGEPFYAAGTNNYRPMFLDPTVVDQIMAAAADNDLPVLRAWAFNDIGDPADPSTSIDPQNTTTYFHYWDVAAGAPAFNDGADGLESLDHVIASAAERGVKLVLPFVNNWGPYGGMDQYVQWAGAEYHSDFFTDETIRGWYRDWVEHLLTRVNTVTGVAYKDDPTIMAWELANEPRCATSGRYEPGPECTTEAVTAWATEMAAFVKSIDDNHLLGLGDEGWLCTGGGEGHWAYDCSQGVDGEVIAALEDIDMVGMHLYPDHWDTSVDWSEQYIRDHGALADAVGKPLFIGEYGWRGEGPRSLVFEQWLRAFFESGGDVALYWIMQPRDEFTTPPDSDGFTAYCPSAVCTQVGQWTAAYGRGERDLPPVAEVDVLVTDAGVPGEVDLVANDVSLFAELDAATVDLDPGTDGQQAEMTVEAGEVSVVDGVLTLVPADGFTGRDEISYTVRDVNGLGSAPTRVTLRVNTPE